MRGLGIAVVVAALAAGCGAKATAGGPPTSSPGVLVSELEPPPKTAASEWSEVELPHPIPDLCRDLCLREDACRAFTYINPGIAGPRARCLTKK
jgi:PAN domain